MEPDAHTAERPHPRRRRGGRRLLVAAAALFVLGTAAVASASVQGTPQPRPEQLGILTPKEFPLVSQGVRLLYDGYYDRAAETFDRLRSLIPESPAGELGRVLPYAVRLREDPENPGLRKALEKGLSAVERKARALLKKNEDDPRGLFYVGAVHFFRSQAQRHRRAYWSAVQELRAARKYLGRVVDQREDAWEAYVGLGGYNYFMDALPAFTKFIRWALFLPGGSREKGLRQLQLAMTRSVLLGPLAQNILLVAYTAYEKQPARAEDIALALHREFPNNPWFHLNLGYLYLATPGRAVKAVKVFREVLERRRAGHPNYIREIADRARLGLVAALGRLGRGRELRAAAGKLLSDPPVRPKYAAPLARLLLGEQLARDGDAREARKVLDRVVDVKDWGHFDWRVREMGFDSGEDIRWRAFARLRELRDDAD